MNKKIVMTGSILPLTVLLLLIMAGLGGGAMSMQGEQTGSEDEEVRQLLIVLRDEQLRYSEPDRVLEAIKRLGEMKAATAIDDLIQLLTFRYVYNWEMSGRINFGNNSIFRRYPATQALFQIGKPSLPALVKAIETNESGSLASENARNTLMKIFQWNPPEGVEYLRKAALDASTLEASALLSEAAEKSAEEVRKLMQRQ